MKPIDKNINVLTMKYPASWNGKLCRDGLVSGNGKIGANIFGGAGKESIIINHAELWSGKPTENLPDVSRCLEKIRNAMDAGRFQEANEILPNALKEKGYDNKRGYPLPLAQFDMIFTRLPGFSEYLRAVNMETGEVSSQFRENNILIKKDLFVSRKDNIIVLSIKSEEPILNAAFSLDLRDGRKNRSEVYEYIKSRRKTDVRGNILTYQSVNTDNLPYGAAAKIENTDGTISVCDGKINVKGSSEILVKIKVFANGESDMEALCNELEKDGADYDYYLKRHIPLHSALYHSASLNLGENNNLSNEELLLKAYSGASPNELIEKLWRYGRYLFISGSSIDGLPFTMYGIWAYEYNQIWSHNMANENIQMMYWHINVGNLTELAKSLFTYYNSRMDAFYDNAKKLYGCGGIFIPAGTTPNMPMPNQIVPVILNWTGAAGWLAQHYYRYYLYTGDKSYLKDMILPFMKAAADFYEDFIVFDETGKAKIYPSVSPENSPQNFVNDNECTGHHMPTTINSTIDMAIIRELFTNLVKISVENNIYTDKRDAWNKIINSIPEYGTNEYGAVKEWQDKRFDDRYYHRHLSHLYPVFPGEEITTRDSGIEAFKKAVDMREIGAQTGWSLAHMASIYARLERGNDAMKCLNNIAKTCMQNNLFTLHNDWRHMDISLEMESDAPVQLDAAMGYVNAVQEMILYSSENLIKLLPALPDNIPKGYIKNWRFTAGSINMEWDIDNNKFEAQLCPDRNVTIDIMLPTMFNGSLKKDGILLQEKDNVISVRFKKGEILNVYV